MPTFKYNCDNCSIHTNSKQTYNRHIVCIRHKEMHETNTNEYIYTCDKCSKKFKCYSGKWQHHKRCKKQPEVDIEELTEKVDKITDMLVEIKMNQCPTTTNTTITQNNQNQNNNNFNVNVFLNENCTNAKNFIDMINDIQLDTVYHEYISNEDYVNSIVRMIKSEIDKLPIIERPIQCIKNEDENQQILHIRHNNKWNKETELEWTQQIHNYYIDDEDEPSEENKKIIFYGLKQMEDNIIEQIQKLYQHTGKLNQTHREYKSEMSYVPNKMRIIKSLIEYVNITREELNQIIDEAYKQLKQQINL